MKLQSSIFKIIVIISLVSAAMNKANDVVYASQYERLFQGALSTHNYPGSFFNELQHDVRQSACQNLITVTNANSSGPDSLVQAIDDVCDGGTITFDDDYSISHLIIHIEKSMTIDAGGHMVSSTGGMDMTNPASTVIINGLIFDGKKSSFDGILNYATLTLNDCVIKDLKGNHNFVLFESEGAVYNEGTLFINRCTIEDNIGNFGGGITNRGVAVIDQSAILGNYSGTKGGGINNDSNARVTVTRSTIAQNTALFGGGIANNGNMTLNNTTISENQSSSYGGGFYLEYDAAVWNSIIAGNTPSDYYEEAGHLNTQAGVIVGNSGLFLTPLGDYGGPTKTYALLPGSLAINGGDSHFCTGGADQRGVNYTGACDIGAFESQGFSLAIDGGNNQSAWVSRSFTDALVVSITANNPLEPVNGGRVTFSAPGSGASASLATNPASIISALSSVTANANAITGSYSVTASTNGAGSAANFNLTNLATPSVTTDPASLVTSTGATLNGTVNVGGVPTNLSFEYGMSTGYGTTVSATPATLSSTNDTAMSAAISGLTPNTVYHFRAIASNAGGTQVGADQTFTPQTMDFGDLPESYGTSLAANGPHHIVTAHPFVYLGSYIDTEDNGTPSSSASSDDLSNLDDEDGITLVDPAAWMPGMPAQINVIASNNGFLNAWMDFNKDGTFDGMEHIFMDRPISAGVNQLMFVYPIGANANYTNGIPARFRVTSSGAMALTPTGMASDGEVEDYIFRSQVLSINDINLAEGDSGTTDFVFTVTSSAPAPAGGITFDIATADGTATTVDNDYTSISLTGQNIPEGDTSFLFAVPVNGDTDAESDEIFTVNIANIDNATAGDTQGLGTIENDDFSVSVVTGIHDAAHMPISSATLGDSLHAFATVSGSGVTPTGTVQFTVYDNPACSGTGTSAGSATLIGGVADPSHVSILTDNGLSFRTHYDGDSVYNASDGNCTTIFTSSYPTILPLSVNTLPQEGSTLNVRMVTLQVQFSMDVRHGDSSDPDSADNPENYLLINTGENGMFDTQACGPAGSEGLKADDVRIPLTSVSYTAETFIAQLSVNPGGTLPNGEYRLFVCGTTSIVDASGSVYLNNHAVDSTITFNLALPSSQTDDPITTSVTTLPVTGFTPGKLTILPEQPLDRLYKNTGMWLEIPEINLKNEIVGVPGTDWDVSWLGDQIGYLEGTAYPTFSGNSVLTGHYTNSFGYPGPFADLGTLSWGDRIILHAWGNEYIYEVRETKLLVSPKYVNVLKQEGSLSWLTLLTCRGYDENTDSYRWRTIVRAVLVEVK